jgi:hypothetical protein
VESENCDPESMLTVFLYRFSSSYPKGNARLGLPHKSSRTNTGTSSGSAGLYTRSIDPTWKTSWSISRKNTTPSWHEPGRYATSRDGSSGCLARVISHSSSCTFGKVSGSQILPRRRYVNPFYEFLISSAQSSSQGRHQDSSVTDRF